MARIENIITENMDVWSSAIKQRNTQGRGSSKRQELYGVQKLRELILDLAVRGLLVPQDPNDEPASVLLETISEKRAELVKLKLVKKQKHLTTVDENETTYNLPTSWIWTRLGSIAEIGPRNNNVTDDTRVSFVPMPLISTSHEGEHGQEDRLWSEIKKGYTHFANGDIALAKITPCFENSKAAVFKELVSGVGAGTTELHVARPFSKDLEPLYVLLYLKSPIFLNVGKTKMTGSAGQKRVPTNFFAENPFPLAPLNEQKRIVAKVDELMALCDQLEQQQENSITAHQQLVETLLAALTQAADNESFEQAWSRIAANFDTLFTTENSIDQLKQTLLQLAVMGKLMPQDPSDEPASVLLEKIAAEKERLIKEKKIKKQKLLPKIIKRDESFEIPSSWKWIYLADIASFENGDRSSKYPNKTDLVEEGIPFFGAADIQDGKLSFTDDLRFISKDKFISLSSGKLKDRDFVMLLRGTVGKTAQFLKNAEHETGFINAQMLIVRLIEKNTDSFLYFYLSSATFIKYIIDEKSGAVIQQLPASKIAEVKIPLPPLAEQKRIVEKVDQLFAICGQLQTKINAAQQTQLKLADAITSQAIQ